MKDFVIGVSKQFLINGGIRHFSFLGSIVTMSRKKNPNVGVIVHQTHGQDRSSGKLNFVLNVVGSYELLLLARMWWIH